MINTIKMFLILLAVPLVLLFSPSLVQAIDAGCSPETPNCLGSYRVTVFKCVVDEIEDETCKISRDINARVRCDSNCDYNICSSNDNLTAADCEFVHEGSSYKCERTRECSAAGNCCGTGTPIPCEGDDCTFVDGLHSDCGHVYVVDNGTGLQTTTLKVGQGYTVHTKLSKLGPNSNNRWGALWAVPGDALSNSPSSPCNFDFPSPPPPPYSYWQAAWDIGASVELRCREHMTPSSVDSTLPYCQNTPGGNTCLTSCKSDVLLGSTTAIGEGAFNVTWIPTTPGLYTIFCIGRKSTDVHSSGIENCPVNYQKNRDGVGKIEVTVEPSCDPDTWVCSSSCGAGIETNACHDERPCTRPCGPWWQVVDGDVQTNGNLNSGVPDGLYFNLSGLGGFPGVVKYGGSTSLTNAKVSTKGWLANSLYTPSNNRIQNYAYFRRMIPEETTINPVEGTSFELNGEESADGYYWYEYDGAASHLPLTISSPINLTDGTKVVLLVTGANLNIEKSITYTSGKSIFVILTDGEILIDPSLGGASSPLFDLMGFFLADGNISTGTSANSLRFKGSLATQVGLTLGRDIEGLNSTRAAEIFEYDPASAFLFPPKLQTEKTRWKEVAP